MPHNDNDILNPIKSKHPNIARLENMRNDGEVAFFKILVEGREITDEIEIESIYVENMIDAPDRAGFTIVNAVNVPEAEIYWLGDEFKLGQGIEIQTGYLDKTDAVFKGIITSLKANIDSITTQEIIVSALDHSFAMQRENKSRVWNDKSDSEIASLFADEYNLNKNIKDTNLEHKSVIQFEENDFHFLYKIAKQNGFEFYVFNGTLNFKKPDYSQRPMATYKLGIDIDGFSGEQNITGQPKEIAESIAKTEPQQGTSCFSKGNIEVQGNPLLVPGKNITLQGLGKAFNKNYYITKTDHIMSAGNYITTLYLRQMDK